MRLLFITGNRIGDAMLTTGVFAAQARAHPDLRAWVACGPLAAPLFADAPGVERVIEMKKRPRKGHWVRLFRATALRRWDKVIDLRDSAVSRLLPFARKRIFVGKGPDDRHRVAFLGDAFGLAEPPDPVLWIGPDAAAAARAAIPDGPPVLALAPGANWLGKRWRPEFFAELARRALSARGPFAEGRLAVLGAEEDRGVAEPTLAAVPSARRIDLVGAGDVQFTGALVARCAAFVGNDSGLAHVAAATGVPTLALFGPGMATVFQPWGANAAICRAQISEAELNRIRWAHPEKLGTLMDSLTVSMVERALSAALEKKEIAA